MAGIPFPPEPPNITDFDCQISLDDYRASWSPDGTKIAFASSRDVNNGTYHDDEIYVMNANGTNPVQLTDNEYRNTAPTVVSGRHKNCL